MARPFRAFDVVVPVLNLYAPIGKGGGLTTGDLGKGGGSIFRLVLGAASWVFVSGDLTRRELPQTGQMARPVAETALIKMDRPQVHLIVIAMWSTPSSDRSSATKQP